MTKVLSKLIKDVQYNRNDFSDLLAVIKDFKNLIVLPNVWTEVDNLLNNFSGDYKWIYIQQVITIIKESTEKYLHTKLGFENDAFWDLGLTGSLLLDIGKECDFIITSDSKLSDYALANGLKVYDLVKIKNQSFR